MYNLFVDESEAETDHRLSRTDKVIVLIGPREVAFTVDMNTICARSAFFRDALFGEWEWIGGRKGMVSITETEPEIFAVYASWIYDSKISLDEVADSSTIPDPPSYISLAKAWVLGNKLSDYEFCNRLNDLVLEKYGVDRLIKVAPVSLQYVWKKTSPASKLRLLHIDIQAGCVTLDSRLRLGPSIRDRCYYHVHEDGNDRCTA